MRPTPKNIAQMAKFRANLVTLFGGNETALSDQLIGYQCENLH
jgi:hypothetical protein